MTSAIFKSPVAIVMYILAGLGIVSIAGYNFWGWFGGSDAWKLANNIPVGRMANNYGSTEQQSVCGGSGGEDCSGGGKECYWVNNKGACRCMCVD